MTALALAAAIALPGVAYMAGATALRTWRQTRRGAYRMIQLRPGDRLANGEG